MKRSPSCSSSSSSSSSCVESVINPNQLGNNDMPKSKRARVKKDSNSDKISNSSSGRRSSIYRGVTRHRWTGRFEAHLWDKSTWNSIQNKKGRQIYLGAYDNEETAAHTYDLAALKYWGPGTTLNFQLETYTKEIEEMEKMTKEEYLASLRRQSSGFSRGVSKYRGVARHHHNGRWEARIGRVFGNKYLYLGTYSTQEEAAAAYDMAAIQYRGPNAVTNFDASVYAGRLKEKKMELSSNHFQQPDTASPLSEEQRQQQQQRQQCGQQCQQQQLVRDQECEQEEKQVLVQSQTLHLGVPSSIDFVEMNDHDEHPWSLCMDPEFHPLPAVPDVAYGRGGDELPYLFDETGFHDDIEFVFDGPMEETLSFDTDSFFAISTVKEEETEKEGDQKMPSPGLLPLSSSSSSPSSSTTTLVFCN